MGSEVEEVLKLPGWPRNNLDCKHLGSPKCGAGGGRGGDTSPCPGELHPGAGGVVEFEMGETHIAPL